MIFVYKMNLTDLPTDLPTEDTKFRELEGYFEDLPEAEGRGKKLFSRKHVMFTYKTHINKVELNDFMKFKMFKTIEKEFPFWRAAHETGDAKNPYKHTHVLVDFGKAWQCSNSRFFDWVENHDDPNSVIHPNMKGIVNAKHFANAKAYLSKEDPENADLKPKFEPSLVAGIWNTKNKAEALQTFCAIPGDASGILAIYECKPMNVCEIRISEFRRWQLEVKNICEQDEILERSIASDPGTPGYFENGEWIPGKWDTPKFNFKSGTDRKIRVIYDPDGNTGKTWFCKQMMLADPSKYFSVGTMSSTRDMSTVIQGAFETGWSGHTLFINLTRACADHKIYDPLEAIRDGMMTSQKYRGHTMLWDMKNVWMFMNWMPKFTAVSLDRWQVWRIHKKTKGLEFVPTAEAMSIWRDETEARLALLETP